MHRFIFIGPSSSTYLEDLTLSCPVFHLSHVSQAYDYPSYADAIFILPPVAAGDLIPLECYDYPFCIGIIDGYFENRLAILHKEILYFLAQGIPVFGAASMGALRASELDVFGMKGIGTIYESYAQGSLEDDDEVTVNHGPSELGYPQISEAMVNITATLNAALAAGILSHTVHNLMHTTAKSLFYKGRNYGYIIQECIRNSSLSEKDFGRFHIWLQHYRVDQKKIDAHTLITEMDQLRHDGRNDETLPRFEFQDTIFWRKSIAG